MSHTKRVFAIASIVNMALCMFLVFVYVSLHLVKWPVNTRSKITNCPEELLHDHNINVAVQEHSSGPVGDNIVVMFTGRWKFIRVNFPYIYRDLRENGGVLDKVYYMMVKYNTETETKLKQITDKANKLLGRVAFEMRYLPPHPRIRGYQLVYSQIFPELIANPYNKYIKMDDDIVYIHPRTFEMLLNSREKLAGKCFLHFGNIVTNWRSSITHERMGLFHNSAINPQSLKFDHNATGNCGWSSVECAELVLDSFLYYYGRGEVDKYLFDGCEQLADRVRYSINFMLIDKDVLNIEALLQVRPIFRDDEGWWTQVYSSKNKEPNCIIGGAFVVHFSYYVTYDAILKKGYLEKFENIVQKEIGSSLPDAFWTSLDF